MKTSYFRIKHLLEPKPNWSNNVTAVWNLCDESAITKLHHHNFNKRVWKCNATLYVCYNTAVPLSLLSAVTQSKFKSIDDSASISWIRCHWTVCPCGSGQKYLWKVANHIKICSYWFFLAEMLFLATSVFRYYYVICFVYVCEAPLDSGL